MKQYVVIARDGVDDKALERRMEARPIHLAGASSLKASGNFIIGGAMLNNEGQMEGSVMILQFETEEAFDNWYKNEPYITNGVWKTIEIKPFKVATVL
ncbi:MAG: YciI family protein [Chitinophagaceae bacterium]